MLGITQQLLLQHNKLHSLLEDMRLYGQDEAGSPRAAGLITDFSDLMRRHLAFESRQLGLRTLDAAAAQAFDAHLITTTAALDATCAGSASAAQQPLDVVTTRLADLLAAHLAEAAHKKLLPHSG